MLSKYRIAKHIDSAGQHICYVSAPCGATCSKMLDRVPPTGLRVLRSGIKLSPPRGRLLKHAKRALHGVPLAGWQVLRNGEKFSHPRDRPPARALYEQLANQSHDVSNSQGHKSCLDNINTIGNLRKPQKPTPERNSRCVMSTTECMSGEDLVRTPPAAQDHPNTHPLFLVGFLARVGKNKIIIVCD